MSGPCSFQWQAWRYPLFTVDSRPRGVSIKPSLLSNYLALSWCPVSCLTVLPEMQSWLMILGQWACDLYLTQATAPPWDDSSLDLHTLKHVYMHAQGVSYTACALNLCSRFTHASWQHAWGMIMPWLASAMTSGDRDLPHHTTLHGI